MSQSGGPSSRVDIYDVSSNTWSTAELSEPRYGIAAAVVGNKVFFAGGGDGNNTVTNKVDIYDLSSNTWSTATLSQARTDLAATTAGNKIYFTGGWNYSDGPTSDRIDIYDNTTGSWSISSLKNSFRP